MNNQYNVKAATPSVGALGALGAGIGFSPITMNYSLPIFFYFYLIDINRNRNFVLKNMPDFILDDAIEYTNTRKLKTALLKIKRDKIFNNNIGRSNSIIINEIIGIYDFLKRAKQYCWATARIYFDA
jgi:hypothetical protein